MNCGILCRLKMGTMKGDMQMASHTVDQDTANTQKDDTSLPPLPRCVALTQERRGHGVSVATYYLGRVLVLQGLRVLIADLTGRFPYAQNALKHDPTKNLALWAPGAPRAENLRALLAQARKETRGRVDVILLDADAALLEAAGGLDIGLDYVLTLVESGETGYAAADRVATRLGDQLPPHQRVGVVYSRIDEPNAEALPDRTPGRGQPTIGYYPADYLLAVGADSAPGTPEMSWPHDNYLAAILKIGRTLTKVVPLQRLSVNKATSTQPAGA